MPKDYANKTGNKVPLPFAWHAAPAPELQTLTGVPDVTFCHASGFMCSVGSVEGARKLAALAQAAYKKYRAEKHIGINVYLSFNVIGIIDRA